VRWIVQGQHSKAGQNFLHGLMIERRPVVPFEANRRPFGMPLPSTRDSPLVRSGARSWIEHSHPHSGHLAARPHCHPSFISTFFSGNFSSMVLTSHGLPMPKSIALCFAVHRPCSCPKPAHHHLQTPTQNARPAERSVVRREARGANSNSPPTTGNHAAHYDLVKSRRFGSHESPGIS
jgi:hypothetical protein